MRLHTHKCRPHSIPTRRSSDLNLRLARRNEPPNQIFEGNNSAKFFVFVHDRGQTEPSSAQLLHGSVWPRSWTKTKKDRKSTRLNSSHRCISYAVFCLKKTLISE